MDANKGIEFVCIRVDSRLEKPCQRTKAKANDEWTLMGANKNGSNSCAFVSVRGWKNLAKETKAKRNRE
jgi:hypothetical protein